MKKVIHRIYDLFLEKISQRRSSHPIYILPTFDGLKVVALNFILLAIGLTYANNYVLLFNFILFCLLLASMFYTHFNLQGVRFVSLKSSELYAQTTSSMEFIFQCQAKGTHYFLKPFIKINGFTCETTEFNISENTMSVQIKLTPHKRGSYTLKSVGLETRFPFNFFSCFTFFSTDISLIVFPEKKSVFPIKISPHPLVNINNEPDVTHRSYRIGDNLKRVDWKKVAQLNRWYTKEDLGEIDVPVILENDIDFPIEDSLSSICAEIQKLRTQGTMFGLVLNGKLKCQPSTGPVHVTKCLKELALHGP